MSGDHEGDAKSASLKQKLESELPFSAGFTTKDSRYLKRIVDAIEAVRTHPWHHGVRMQAHHVISATAMHKSGLAEQIRKFGYDINRLENLAFLPSTLQGACHLGVQPHRGNHTTQTQPEGYEDDEHPRDYHHMVELRLKKLQMGLTKECPGYMGGEKEREARSKVTRELDELSAWTLRLIQNSPRQAPLTSANAHFQPGNPVGCADSDSTTTHLPKNLCMVHRDHLGKQGPKQRAENITFRSEGRYQLRVGR